MDIARTNPPNYEGQPQITGYVARNSVAVTITRLGITGEVIAAAFAAGANSVEGPNLDSSALVKAKSGADAYASGLGKRVAQVLRVSERGNAARQFDYVKVTATRSPSRAPPPPVAGGDMQRSATIRIDYALVTTMG